jgi:hypothetical protein
MSDGYAMDRYERDRLGRYGHTPQNEPYSQSDLLLAYDIWSQDKHEDRQKHWDFYCDVRDCVKLGTNAKITKMQKEKRERYSYN